MPRTVVVNGAALRVSGGLGPRPACAPKPTRARGVAATSSDPLAGAPASASAPTTTERTVGVPLARLALPRVSFRPGAGDVRPEDLPPSVRRLLWYHVDSAEKIGLLDHARTGAAPWTAREAATALALGERALAVAAVGLCQADLLRRRGDAFHGAPLTEIVGAAIDVIRRAYGREPSRVLQAIARLVHGRSSS